jgi:antitoxin (DNA-binding transcriptional repressor) of toxin-antitoxin stability system
MGSREEKALGTRITLAEALRSLPQLLERVRLRGERFVIVEDDQPVAELVPATGGEVLRGRDLPQVLASLPHLDVEDAERFAAELAAARKASGPAPMPPWAY